VRSRDGEVDDLHEHRGPLDRADERQPTLLACAHVRREHEQRLIGVMLDEEAARRPDAAGGDVPLPSLPELFERDLPPGSPTLPPVERRARPDRSPAAPGGAPGDPDDGDAGQGHDRPPEELPPERRGDVVGTELDVPAVQEGARDPPAAEQEERGDEHADRHRRHVPARARQVDVVGAEGALAEAVQDAPVARVVVEAHAVNVDESSSGQDDLGVDRLRHAP
jgi:hypothetical protein